MDDHVKYLRDLADKQMDGGLETEISAALHNAASTIVFLSPAPSGEILEAAAKAIWAKADFHSNGAASQNTWENISQPVRDWAVDVAQSVISSVHGLRQKRTEIS